MRAYTPSTTGESATGSNNQTPPVTPVVYNEQPTVTPPAKLPKTKEPVVDLEQSSETVIVDLQDKLLEMTTRYEQACIENTDLKRQLNPNAVQTPAILQTTNSHALNVSTKERPGITFPDGVRPELLEKLNDGRPNMWRCPVTKTSMRLPDNFDPSWYK